jgi:hypothetical protein
VKAAKLPDDSNTWQSWPTFDVLHAESDMKIGVLRSRLVAVPCYRCPDKSVRYEPEAAQTAMFGNFSEAANDDDDDQDDEAGDGSDGQKPIGIITLTRELMKMLGESRKDRSDVIRVMQQPLDTGIRLLEAVVGVQAARLATLEAQWSRMLVTTEEMIAASHGREATERQAAHSREYKLKAWDFVKENVPTVLGKWSLTTEATMALNLIASLDPKIVDSVVAAGVLDQDQIAVLMRLRESLAAKQAQHQKANPENDNHASPKATPENDTHASNGQSAA